jgi:hypothetical protein
MKSLLVSSNRRILIRLNLIIAVLPASGDLCLRFTSISINSNDQDLLFNRSVENDVVDGTKFPTAKQKMIVVVQEFWNHDHQSRLHCCNP